MSRQAGQMAGQLASELRRADQWKYSQFGIRSLEKLPTAEVVRLQLFPVVEVYFTVRLQLLEIVEV